MSTPANPAAVHEITAATVAIECVVCATTQLTTTIAGRTVLSDHDAVNTEDPTDTAKCPGSGLPGVTGDPAVDDFRRRAVREMTRALNKAAAERADFAGALARGWSMRKAVSYYGLAGVSADTVASLWREAAAAGEWWPAVCAAMGRIAAAAREASTPLDQAVEHETASGAQKWLRDVRFDIIATHPNGVNQDQLADLLGRF